MHRSLTEKTPFPTMPLTLPLPLVFALLTLLCSPVGAQPPSDNRRSDNNQYEYANFSPSMAIIIVILIAALFLMGFFSIYIRHCSESATGGNSVRHALSLRRRAAARGLDAAVIETFPMFTYAEVKDHHYGKEALECAVCLCEFEDDETLRLIPKCDHVFHPECIGEWLQNHVTCPVCRSDLAEPAPSLAPEPVQVNQNELESEVVPATLREEEVNRPEPNQSGSVRPVVNRKGSLSMKRTRNMFTKFRSNSTGHNSVVVPGENLDRYTLRLPEGIRKEVMNRAWLNRTRTLPNRFRTEEGGSSRGGRSYRRIEKYEPKAKSDRWVFGLFSRPKPDNEGSTSSSRGGRTAVKMPSFKCLEPKGDQTCLVSAEPPV